MTVFGLFLLRLVFWLAVAAAVAAVAVACLGTAVLGRARTLVCGRPDTTPRGAQPILR